jgi:hypothetical protein
MEAAQKLKQTRGGVTKALGRMHRHFETEAQQLNREICEALEVLRTGRDVFLRPESTY